MKKTVLKKYVSIAMCSLALASLSPAFPAFARTNTHASSQASGTTKMRNMASRVQAAFENNDFDKLADLCNYPVVVIYAGGDILEIQNKSEFIALGSQTFFTKGMKDAIASTNTAKLNVIISAGVQMGGDVGLSLSKFNGSWKINSFYLDSASPDSSFLFTNSSDAALTIQKTFSYRDLEGLSKICNFPLAFTYPDGTTVEVKNPTELLAMGEDKVFTEQLGRDIDQTDITHLQEFGNGALAMGRDSGLNLYKVDGYWKINQIYQ